MSTSNEAVAKQFCLRLDYFTMDSLISTYKLKTLVEDYKGPRGRLEVRLYDTMPKYRFEYYGSDKNSLIQQYSLSKKNGFFVKPAEVLQEYSETEQLWSRSVPLHVWLVKHSGADLHHIIFDRYPDHQDDLTISRLNGPR